MALSRSYEKWLAWQRRSKPLRSKTPLKSTGRINPRNEDKRERDWKRAYGSEDRVLFVHSLGCCVCGEPAENAHLPGSGGMGMKGPYTDIVPLCPRHHRAGFEGSLHELGSVERFDERWGVDLVAVAEETERRWRERER